jgi:hypothetical protein
MSDEKKNAWMRQLSSLQVEGGRFYSKWYLYNTISISSHTLPQRCFAFLVEVFSF